MQEGQQSNDTVSSQNVYQPAPQDSQGQAQVPEEDYSISWTASEFIAHTKTSGWYAILGVGAVVAAVAIYLLTKDIITSGMVLIVAILFGVMAARKPRELAYTISEDGITIGEKFYPYERFKSFSVIQEEGIESIWFMPLQRFMPGLSIYFEPQNTDMLADALSNFLPFEPRDLDPLDRLMHKIRF